MGSGRDAVAGGVEPERALHAQAHGVAGFDALVRGRGGDDLVRAAVQRHVHQVLVAQAFDAADVSGAAGGVVGVQLQMLAAKAGGVGLRRPWPTWTRAARG